MLAGFYELASKEHEVISLIVFFNIKNQVLNDVYQINSITIVYLIFLIYGRTKDACTYLQIDILTIYAIFFFILHLCNLVYQGYKCSFSHFTPSIGNKNIRLFSTTKPLKKI